MVRKGVVNEWVLVLISFSVSLQFWIVWDCRGGENEVQEDGIQNGSNNRKWNVFSCYDLAYSLHWKTKICI